MTSLIGMLGEFWGAIMFSLKSGKGHVVMSDWMEPIDTVTCLHPDCDGHFPDTETLKHHISMQHGVKTGKSLFL